jgi:hypothetical protein
LPKGHILRLTAQELDLAAVGHFEKMTISTREFYCALIMAKRSWEEYTNEMDKRERTSANN